MKVQIEKKVLQAKGALVTHAVAKSSDNAVLNGLFIEAKDGMLKLSGTDMTIGITSSTDAVEVISEGSCIIPGGFFRDLVPKLTDGVITLEVDDNKLEVRYGKNKARINLINGIWPGMPGGEPEYKFSLPQDVFKNGLSLVSFAVAKTHFRAVFTGVYFEIANGTLSLVASDTHQLAVARYPVEAEDWQVIVPGTCINELQRVFKPEVEKTISMYTVGNNVMLEWCDTKFWTRVIEGVYPQYRQVIPKEETIKTNITFGTSDLVGCLSRFKILRPEGPVGFPVAELRIDREKMQLKGASDTVGTLVEACPVDTMEGEEMVISFNSDLLDNALAVMGDKALLQLGSSVEPAVMRTPDQDDHLVVVVPVRTNN